MARQQLATSAALAALICAGAYAGACSGDRARFEPREDDFAQQVADRIEVRESQPVFAVFALLNTAGYDDETGADLHAVRKAVRGAMPRVLPDAMFTRIEAFYKTHASNPDVAGYALAAIAAPDTSLLPARTYLTRVPALLRDFSAAARIDSLYKVHQLRYRVWIADLTPAVRREVAEAYRYMRVTDTADLKGSIGAVVIPNLLQSHDHQFAFRFADSLRVLVGPSQVIGFDPRAFVRAHLDAAVATTGDSLAESVARAVALRYVVAREPGQHDKQWARAEAEARAGLVLVPYFYEQLVRYEKQSLPLKEYYPRLLDALDAGREAARWR